MFSKLALDNASLIAFILFMCSLTTSNESAQLRVLRGKNVLACQRALRASVPLLCLVCLRAHVSTCLACLCAQVPMCLACLHAHVPTCLTCLRAYVPTCLVCLYAHMPTPLEYLCAHVPTFLQCLHAIKFKHAILNNVNSYINPNLFITRGFKRGNVGETLVKYWDLLVY